MKNKENIPELPHPFLMEIGEGPLPGHVRAETGKEMNALWGTQPVSNNEWVQGMRGEADTMCYAVDVRSEYAKRCFPHLVDEHNQRATEESMKINEESTQEPSFQKERKTELPPEYWQALSKAITKGQELHAKTHKESIKEQVDRMIACFEQASK